MRPGSALVLIALLLLTSCRPRGDCWSEALHWKPVAFNLQYRRDTDALNKQYPLIFDGTVLKVTRGNPSQPATGQVVGVVYNDHLLEVRIDKVLNGHLTTPQTIRVVVPDVVSSFPSGPTPYFETGRYRFFCNKTGLEHTTEIGTTALIFAWLE